MSEQQQMAFGEPAPVERVESRAGNVCYALGCVNEPATRSEDGWPACADHAPITLAGYGRPVDAASMADVDALWAAQAHQTHVVEAVVDPDPHVQDLRDRWARGTTFCYEATAMGDEDSLDRGLRRMLTLDDEFDGLGLNACITGVERGCLPPRVGVMIVCAHCVRVRAADEAAPVEGF